MTPTSCEATMAAVNPPMFDSPVAVAVNRRSTSSRTVSKPKFATGASPGSRMFMTIIAAKPRGASGRKNTTQPTATTTVAARVTSGRCRPARAEMIPMTGPTATLISMLTTSTVEACPSDSPMPRVISGLPHSRVKTTWLMSVKWMKKPSQQAGCRTTTARVRPMPGRAGAVSPVSAGAPATVGSGVSRTASPTRTAMSTLSPPRLMNALPQPEAWSSAVNGTAEMNWPM
jgi:hypothetical protein